MEKFLDQYGYFALLVGTFLEGETAILVASSLIHRGMFDPGATVTVAFAGSFISDWIYYLIGRINGKYFIERRPKLQHKLEPVTKFFQQNKIQILFTYRFLYGFRIIIPLIIGMSKIKPLQYLLFSFIAGLLWASTVSVIGYFIGRFLDVSVTAFEQNIVFIIIGFAGLGLLVGYLIKKIFNRKILV
ncbi:MAG: DedA family protein [Bacteroidota bacterium]